MSGRHGEEESSCVAPRWIATPDGPALLVPSGGHARRIAAAIGRAVETSTLPRESAVVTTLRRFGRQLVTVELQRDRGDGFASETPSAGPATRWVTPEEWAANGTGLTPQAATKRCRLGQIPGAQKIGRQWVIPIDEETT